MPRACHIERLQIHPLAIPLRKPFEHAAQTRAVADPIVVSAELSDGTVGYGETLARPYVTGETPESVVETIRADLPDRLAEFRPTCFPEALEAIDTLPCQDRKGRVMTAARAAVELALLDAFSRSFQRPISEAAGWLDLPGLGPPGSIGEVTYSGVLSGSPAKLARKTRMMHWYGLRDFKLKVGYDDDPERVAAVIRVLGRSLGSKATLRLDANGGWKVEDAIARLNALPLGKIACVEQPLDRNHDPYLVELKAMVQVQIMPDESLVTMDDARRLVAMGVADRFNIRISKNGGLLPAIRLAHFARQRGLGYQLGCMVGETSILSAAGRRFLENVPHVCFAEGSYGRFLLLGDVIDRPLQFGCRGRVKALGGYGWGIEVRPDRLRQYAQSATIEVRL